VCVLCGIDCGAVRRFLYLFEYGDSRYGILPDRCGALRYWLRYWHLSAPRDLWEVDHIVPRCEGGTNHMENLRTLCRRCHVRITTDMRRRKAKKYVDQGRQKV